MRPENTESLLATYIEEHRASVFVWGQHDCCLFAANWVHLALGLDPAAEFRGTYNTEKAAHKLLKTHEGVRGLADTFLTRCHLNFALQGDIVAFKTHSKAPAILGTALGILEGVNGVFAGPDGLRFVRREHLMKTAWRLERVDN